MYITVSNVSGLLCRGGEHEYRLTKYLLSNYEQVDIYIVDNIYSANAHVTIFSLCDQLRTPVPRSLSASKCLYIRLLIWTRKIRSSQPAAG